MASTRIDNPLLLSPVIPTECMGFTSDTRRMQMCGWEFAVEQDTLRMERLVMARHRTAGVLVSGTLRDDEMRSRSLVYCRGAQVGFNGPPLVFNRFNAEHRVVMEFVNPMDMMRVNMNPEFTTIEKHRWNGSVADLFRKWAPQSEEIIVAPETVADLYDRIRKLQDPELKEIRDRNRLRDYQQGQATEQVVAQIITLAA